MLFGISQAGKPFIRLIIPKLFETIASLISSDQNKKQLVAPLEDDMRKQLEIEAVTDPKVTYPDPQFGRIIPAADLLNEEKRRDWMLDGMQFRETIRLVSKSHMVVVGRVVLPEYEKQEKLDPKIEQEKDINLTVHSFKTEDESMTVTAVILQMKQE